MILEVGFRGAKAALNRTHSKRSASSRICQNADGLYAMGLPRFDKRGYKAW
jgi:hypothetical protein